MLKTMPSVVDSLNEKMNEVLEKVKELRAFKAVMSPHASPALIRSILKEVYLEIAWYQKDVITTTIESIAFMPRDLPVRLFKSMLIHQAEEFDHGEMAIRDYVALGGSEEKARNSRMSPSSHAVAAFWTYLAYKRDPFAYLGALYMFEGLTPIVSGFVMNRVDGTEYPDNALEFIKFHAEEDIKHQNLIRHLIEKVAALYPGSGEAMLHGFDCFAHIYPLPCWEAAYERALEGQGAGK